jgi:capsule biosynthesis phosphatase
MKLIILCGGNGTRMQDYSFPKPLNMINGKPAIFYSLQHLHESVKDLYFIVAPHLYEFSFEEIIINLFKGRTCHFLKLPYFTRGPIESAFLGTKLLEGEEPVVFLDNDVLYNFPESFWNEHSTAFLGYSLDKSGSESYSYITFQGDTVTQIREKKRISDYFCCGVYGFASIEQFRSIAEPIISSVYTELYMSFLFQELISKEIPIKAIEFPSPILHVGSLLELNLYWNLLPKRTMRICFDLDNTLVTYPTTPMDYKTVKPIPSMIELLQQMKKDGHTIIIYTARRMESHGGNLGKVMRDIGKITLDTLDLFDIPYDEIVFGKPIADMYIDDRAINPYRNDLQCMGYLYQKPERPMNVLPNNKYNDIRLENNKIVKTGPRIILEGEVYYYQHLPSIDAFPLFYGIKLLNDYVEIRMEYIKNISFYSLYQSELLNETHIDLLFESLDVLHHTIQPEHHILPSKEHVILNYTNKLKSRFSNKEDYPFEDYEIYQQKCLSHIEIYTKGPLTIVPYIHGDLWFSNILLTFQHRLKWIDMKGKVDVLLTTGGDIMYDYGKIYQSALGYDTLLYGTSVSGPYAKKIKQYIEYKILQKGVDLASLQAVTISLIMGTFTFIHSTEKKHNVWKWVTRLMDELFPSA